MSLDEDKRRDSRRDDVQIGGPPHSASPSIQLSG